MIYITGDTHGGKDAQKLHSKNFPNYKNCTQNDILIITGDWGYIFENNFEENHHNLEKEKKTIQITFGNRKWGTTLVVDGNHENHDRLKYFPIKTKFGGKVREICSNVFLLLRGEIYTINNLKFFSFGGASSIDKASRTIGYDWWEAETFNYTEMTTAFDNLEKHNYTVDYIITHTCATSTLKTIQRRHSLPIYNEDAHNKLFEEFKQKISFRQWFFGHFHIDDIIEEKEIALFNNIFTIPNNKEKD